MRAGFGLGLFRIAALALTASALVRGVGLLTGNDQRQNPTPTPAP